ncbi:MAG: hypothetical protein IT437_00935 [Phycisphaerales bacterium]|nr:hypothetical protein [Phycisphaerales bacterium]
MMQRLSRFAVLVALTVWTAGASAQTTTFTYQGDLKSAGAPVTGSYDFRFELYPTASGGTASGTVEQTIDVTGGLFTTPLDFGAGQFPGADRWLQISLRPHAVGSYTALTPRQHITPAPYAIGLELPYQGSADLFGAAVSVANTNGAGVAGTNTVRNAAADPTLTPGVIGRSTAAGGVGVSGFADTGSAAIGAYGQANQGFGVRGVSLNGNGIYGTSNLGPGVHGANFGSTAFDAPGVLGENLVSNGIGVSGFADTGPGAYGIYGHANQGFGVRGVSINGNGMYGTSNFGPGVHGTNFGSTATNAAGVLGESQVSGGVGVSGIADSGLAFGVYGEANQGFGLRGVSVSGNGVYGTSTTGPGVHGATFGGNTPTAAGVLGESNVYGGIGVTGIANADGGIGIAGYANVGGTQSVGVFGQSANGFAGWFVGDVLIAGSLSKSSGSFKIDHPLDPANKYLSHSFVESPDMMNIYDGVVTTDARGYATVALPDWFQALNRDFRYQLTVIDESDSADFVQAKIVAGVRDNVFTLRTSAPRTSVSWQVTGIRRDPWANAHRVKVEEDKPEAERGHYLAPELYGKPPSAGISAVKVGAAASAPTLPKG